MVVRNEMHFQNLLASLTGRESSFGYEYWWYVDLCLNRAF